MPEGLTGSEGRQGQYLIKPNESINLFPEDEREEAENIASIHARYIALQQTQRESFKVLYEMYANFYQQLSSAEREALLHSKIHHMLAGSTMTAEQFRNFPLYVRDDESNPSNIMYKFITGDFLNKLKELENRL